MLEPAFWYWLIAIVSAALMLLGATYIYGSNNLTDNQKNSIGGNLLFIGGLAVGTTFPYAPLDTAMGFFVGGFIVLCGWIVLPKRIESC